MGRDRRIGVAVDFSECSNKALRWAMENMVREGDDLIILNIQPQSYYEGGEMQLWETTASPLIPASDFSEPTIMKKYGVKTDTETLEIINSFVRQKEITVVMKIFWGDPRGKICEAIQNIPLSSIVIGNRGLGKIKRVLLGSVSDYVVDNAECPVTVVKNVE